MNDSNVAMTTWALPIFSVAILRAITPTTMAEKVIERVASKDLGGTKVTDTAFTTESDVSNELHFARRGEELAEASSSQESIDGYDPELMSGRTLLTTEEEKKLLRKIDWRLMTLCSLIFMFKNLDSNNVRMQLFRKVDVV